MTPESKFPCGWFVATNHQYFLVPFPYEQGNLDVNLAFRHRGWQSHLKIVGSGFVRANLKLSSVLVAQISNGTSSNDTGSRLSVPVLYETTDHEKTINGPIALRSRADRLEREACGWDRHKIPKCAVLGKRHLRERKNEASEQERDGYSAIHASTFCYKEETADLPSVCSLPEPARRSQNPGSASQGNFVPKQSVTSLHWHESLLIGRRSRSQCFKAFSGLPVQQLLRLIVSDDGFAIGIPGDGSVQSRCNARQVTR